MTHAWKYSQTNGFWAHCSCGFKASSLFDFLLRRKMDRHVREATEIELYRAQIDRLRSPQHYDLGLQQQRIDPPT